MSDRILGLLHTGRSHCDRFDALLRELAPPDVTWTEIVREDLLRAAMDGAPEQQQVAAITGAMTDLRDQGAAHILCTCSSIGRLAEMIGAELQVPTLRVDRPMAERAVAAGGRVLLVACVASTVAPTTELLRACADAAGREVAVETLLLTDAWRWFEQGDEPAFHRAIAEALLRSPVTADAVVLAQASMSGAAALLAQMRMPVLSSPRLGIEAALARLTGRRAA
ncbi:MAG TPA: aspartate/glutamate racemase family protein, partial [Dongiaceae bacterium]|nr:aspartate/glutamate racemase family protein [Dongiaceae bacterium]